jgi:RND family efflux transporter MFP subunit
LSFKSLIGLQALEQGRAGGKPLSLRPPQAVLAVLTGHVSAVQHEALTKALRRPILRDMVFVRTLACRSLMLAALVAVGLVSAGGARAQNGPARVEVDAVRTEPLTQTMPVLGRIVTRQQGPVAARVPGLVDRVAVEVGDRVDEGDPLVWLDAEPLTFERDLAEAEYNAMLAEQGAEQAELQLLEDERARLVSLEGSAAFPKAQLIDKENEIEVARSRIAAAAARIQQYRVKLQRSARDLEDAVIRAPFSGVVSQRQVSAGGYIEAGDPVITLIDDHQLEIEAEVPSDRVAGLAPGTVVRVVLDDGSAHDARVRAVVPEENPLTRTRALRLTPDFRATTKPLAIAQSVTLELPIGESRRVVTVDKDGVIQQPDGAMVYLVEEEAAAPRPVQLGEAVGGRFEVLDGLKPGDLVVVRGNERLQPGQPITYPGAPEPANGPKTES